MIGRIDVSLGALRRNARALQRAVAPSKAAFVVKSNAYGHGLVEVARAVAPLADRLCTYSSEEAHCLRAHGIETPIVVLGPVEPAEVSRAVAADLELALWDAGSFARDLGAAAAALGRRARVHLKINTGLNRMGFEPGALPAAVANLLERPAIDVVGVFSHLAAAEELDSPYTMAQLAAFERALTSVREPLAQRGVVPVRHLAASAAALLWPATRLDLCRFGIALYGLWPSAATRLGMPVELDLEPALAYRSEIAVVRSIAAGTPVGYGLTFHAPRDMRIGVVPVGYADGVPRALSNRGAFAVSGARAPIVGRIAMNVSVVDLSAAPQAHPGTAVTLLGRDGDVAITADDWADWSDTINYEIVARLPAEIPRRYVDEFAAP